VSSPELDAARENLFYTYLALAERVPHTTISLRPEASVAISQTNYSFCNFAMNLHADQHPLALEDELRDYCRHRAMFRVFWTTGDSPENWDTHLHRSGFNPISHLEIMMAPTTGPFTDERWNEASNPDDRHHVSAFMAGQFFGMHEAAFRKTVIESTRDAPHALVYRGGDDCGNTQRGRTLQFMRQRADAKAGIRQKVSCNVHATRERKG
jgi:hypothetical protein